MYFSMKLWRRFLSSDDAFLIPSVFYCFFMSSQIWWSQAHCLGSLQIKAVHIYLNRENQVFLDLLGNLAPGDLLDFLELMEKLGNQVEKVMFLYGLIRNTPLQVSLMFISLYGLCYIGEKGQKGDRGDLGKGLPGPDGPPGSIGNEWWPNVSSEDF